MPWFTMIQFNCGRPDCQILVYDPRIKKMRLCDYSNGTFTEENGRMYHVPHIPYTHWQEVRCPTTS